MREMFKKRKMHLLFMTLILSLAMGQTAFASDGIAEAPDGFMGFIVVVPLIVVIILLIKKFDMLFAGLVGGILAMIIGGVSLAKANELYIAAIPTMLSMTVPIINSAVATAVFKSGGYTSALTLVKRSVKNKYWLLAAFVVLLQAAATYMSGIGGGSAMVIAPLAFSAVGAIPEVIAGMCIATAVCFTTSPASLESGVVSSLAGIEVTEYVSQVRIFTLLFVVISVGIAIYGTIKRNAVFANDSANDRNTVSNGELWKNTIPAIFLLFAVIIGPFINKAAGIPVLGALAYTVITIGLIAICTKFTLKQSCEALVDGSTYILTKLFGVGIFVGFINVIAETGAFTSIVNVAQMAPSFLLVPAMILAGLCIGFPAGAYVGSILTLILPIAVALGFSTLEIGLVTIGVGFGSQISYVNITMQAMSSGFQKPIADIVKGNLKWVAASTVLLMIIGFIV